MVSPRAAPCNWDMLLSDASKTLKQDILALATRAVRAECGALIETARNENPPPHVLYTAPGVPLELLTNFPPPCGPIPITVDDTSRHPDVATNSPIRGYMAVPVISSTGETIGSLHFGHSRPAVFTDEEAWIAGAVARQAALALDNAAGREDLARANEELQRANSDLNDFTFSASHDLQEPLRMISIFAQLLRRKLEGSLDEEGVEYLGNVLRGTHRLQSLVRDFLAYNRTASIPDNEASQSADASVALDIALNNLKPAIREAGAVVEHSALPSVRIRSTPLTEVFQHILANALKYQRQQPPRISISAVRQGDFCVFSVEDNGIGIDEKYKEQIFGIFKRLHTADEYTGTGVGLAICRRIVDRSGGRIWVESEPGRGSVFRFTLPAA